MKKILTITVMLLIVSMAFFSCDDRSFSGYPAPLPAPYALTGAGITMAALNYYTPANAADGVTVTGDTVTFDKTSGTDNHGVKVTLPEGSKGWDKFQYVTVTFQLTAWTGGATNNAKIGFKAKLGTDLTPYDQFEIHFGAGAANVGVDKVLVIPTSKLTENSFLFNHNQYSDDTKAPINYTLKIASIAFSH